MRAYTLIHHYVCGIQSGIQAAHSLVELMVDHGLEEDVIEWSTNHKAVCWLDCWNLDKLWDSINSYFPASKFCEPALGDLCTAISFVADSDQVSIMKSIRDNKYSVVEYHGRVKLRDVDSGMQIGSDITLSEFDILKTIASLPSKVQ